MIPVRSAKQVAEELLRLIGEPFRNITIQRLLETALQDYADEQTMAVWTRHDEVHPVVVRPVADQCRLCHLREQVAILQATLNDVPFAGPASHEAECLYRRWVKAFCFIVAALRGEAAG